MSKKFYFMVDQKRKIIDNIHLFDIFGYYKPGTPDKGEDEDEVFMWAKFATEHLLEAWEAVPGVDPLPHPLDTDETVTEDHMVKLHKHLDVELEEVAVLEPEELPENTADLGNGHANPHAIPQAAPGGSGNSNGNGNAGGGNHQPQPKMVWKKKKQFRDKFTGAVLQKHHNTRTLANQIAKNRDPNFKFRLF